MENGKNEKKVDEELDLFKDLLDGDDDDLTAEEKTVADEEQRRKNKDAEEARKRREAEAKAEAEKSAAAKAEADRIASEKAKTETEAKEKTKNDRTNQLGEELLEFKKKYQNVELVELDKDVNFKKYIDGKLLGKKKFTELYEEYLELRSNLSGKTADEIRANYERKANVSTGSQAGPATTIPADIYSEEELKRLADKLPFMHSKEVDKIETKLAKSIAYYENKK